MTSLPIKGRKHPLIFQSAIKLREGFSLPPSALVMGTKVLPYAKSAAIPLALGALMSLGDNIVDSTFGSGNDSDADQYRVEYVPRSGSAKKPRRKTKIKTKKRP